MNVALNAFSPRAWSATSKRAAVAASPVVVEKAAHEAAVEFARSDVALLPHSEGALLTRYDGTGTYLISYTANYAKVRLAC